MMALSKRQALANLIKPICSRGDFLDRIRSRGMTMQCHNCGHENRSTARFCDDCGNALVADKSHRDSDVSVSAMRDIEIGGDLVGHDKTVIQVFANVLYATTPTSPAPLPMVDALERYLSLLINTNKTLRLHGIRAGHQPISVTLERVYVSLSLKGLSDGATPEPFEGEDQDPVSSDARATIVPLALARHRRLVIVGDPGCGKTTLLSYLTLTYARTALGPDNLVKDRLGLDETDIIPILLPLRDLGDHLRKKHSSPGADGPALVVEFLHEYFRNQSISLPPNFFEDPLHKGHAVVLLDGMDEVADRDLRARVARLIERFVRRFEHNRYVVSCRKVGYDGAARLSEEFVRAEVREFNGLEVRQFLHDWTYTLEASLAGETTESLKERAARQADVLIAGIEHNPRVAELATNPLLLTVIALVHRQLARLPNRRSELYKEAIDVLLGNWDNAKDGTHPGLELAGRLLETDDVRAVLEPVAYWMHEHQVQEIDHDDLLLLLRPAFDKLFGNDAEMFEAASRRFLDLINERSGLFLAHDDGVYRFAHLTFQEYLAARILADRQDAEALIAERLGDPWWRETLFLTPSSSGKGSTRRANQLIRALIEANATGDGLENLVLAAECVLDVGAIRVDGELLSDIRSRLRAETATPDPGSKAQRPAWVLRKVSALRALGRIESGEVSTPLWRRETGEPDWVPIREGPFWMGDQNLDQEGVNNGTSLNQVQMHVFQIARAPITNAQYALYLAETQTDPPQHWPGGRPPQGQDDHPVVHVNWYEAEDYCRWLSAKIGRTVRLPNEAEWEKAARGHQDMRRYPWGNVWDVVRCNSVELGIDGTSPVNVFLSGVSPYGVLDMCGNVWEWCHLSPDTQAHVDEASDNPVVVTRGGSFNGDSAVDRCASRLEMDLLFSSYDDLGFRVVTSLSSR